MSAVWSVVLALPLFLASTVAFDLVHLALHRMLRSRAGWLRALAWPHGVHHRWLDGGLESRWEWQRLNVWCHLVPEYLTQLGFSALCLIVLPAGPVMATVAFQTIVFLLILRERGLDLNHRAVAVLDAYPPALYCPPAYHALHHVHPDAHMSAYLKVVDWVCACGAQIAGRRIAVAGSETPLGRALADALEAAGARVARVDGMTDAAGVTCRVGGDPLVAEAAAPDVLVIADPRLDRAALVETLIDATRRRQLPPEVWAVQTAVADAVARRYYRDVRLIHRALVVPDADRLDHAGARRAARRVLRAVRRGFNFVPSRPGPRGLVELWRFRAMPSPRATAARHRAALLPVA